MICKYTLKVNALTFQMLLPFPMNGQNFQSVKNWLTVTNSTRISGTNHIKREQLDLSLNTSTSPSGVVILINCS